MCLQYKYLKTLWEMEIWSYRTISTVPIVFSTLLENSPTISIKFKIVVCKI